MLIYLSHPIDRADSRVAAVTKQITTQIENQLQTRNAHLFKPGNAFWVGPNSKTDHTIEKINTEAQNQAQAMIVIWPNNATSWGVPVEVERARQTKQPTVIITENNATWSQPWGWTQPLIRRYGTSEREIQNAIEWLTNQTNQQRNQQRPLAFKRLNSNAQKPNRAYNDDAGFDLYVSETTKIKPGKFVDIPCAVAVELPSNTWAMLTGRSSTLRTYGLLVNQGIIDPGYRGELYAGVQNLTRKTITINKGDRVAQLILMPNWTSEHTLNEVIELKQHPRGQKGFGSSGR